MGTKQMLLTKIQMVINGLQELYIKATITNVGYVYESLKCLESMKADVNQLNIVEENQNASESEPAVHP